MFKTWLQITKQSYSNNENEKYSHLMLDGGKLYIKNENINLFNKKYSEAIINNENLFIVEQKKEYFKLFFDLDFKFNTLNFKNDEINSFIINIINTIYNLYNNNKIKCIIATAKLKTISKINENITDSLTKIKIYKKGYHLYFPDIIVNKEIALYIRKICISNVRKMMDYNSLLENGNTFENDLLNNVSDIIDESVFKNNGIRMIGSKKCYFDVKTKSIINEGREYYIESVYIENGFSLSEYDKYNENFKILIQDTSIITNITVASKLHSYEECKECEEGEEGDEDKNKDHIDNSNMGSWIKLNKDTIIYKAIITYFNANVKDYSSNDIRRIYVSNNNKTYLLNSRSKYCQNIGRNHNSEHIYFLLTANGLIQKCFCRCDTLENRRDGYCKDYSSNPIPCTKYIINLLKFKTEELQSSKKTTSHESSDMLLDSVRDSLYDFFTNKQVFKQKKSRKSAKE